MAAAISTNVRLEAQILTPRYRRKQASSKGPRAVGLIGLLPKGDKGRLIPIAIMVDGKFYDAGSYKAAPVPMALDFGIVYEGFRSGVSQGVFTITQPGQLNHSWIAEGKWLPAGAIDPNKPKKYTPPVIEDPDGPPVLHRRSETADADSKDKNKDKADKDKDKDKSSGNQQKPATAPAPPATATPEPAKASPPANSSAPPPDEPYDDPNRPRLRRGKPDTTARQEPFATFDPLMEAMPGAGTGTGKSDEKTTKDSAAASVKSAAVVFTMWEGRIVYGHEP